MATVSKRGPQLVHPWLRWPLRLYKGVLLFVLLALLGNIAVVPLSESASDWPVATLGQIAALLMWVRANPLWTAVVAFPARDPLRCKCGCRARWEQAALDETHAVELGE